MTKRPRLWRHIRGGGYHISTFETAYLLIHARLFTFFFFVKLFTTLKKLILGRSLFILFVEGSARENAKKWG